MPAPTAPTAPTAPDPPASLAPVLALTWAAAAALRAAVAAVTPLGPDGAVELGVARALAEGRPGDALDLRFHPLFAALVAAVARATGVDPAGDGLEAVARAVAPLVSALVAPLVAWTAAALSPARPRRAAAVAGLLAAAQPALVRQGGQVLAYGAAHAALALALALALRAARRPGLGAAAAVGLAVGLGWTARSDALATGAGLLAGLLAGAAWPAARGAPGGLACGAAGEREGEREGGDLARRGRAAAALGLGFALGLGAGMAPYALALRVHTGEWRVSLKKRLGDVVRLPDLAPAPAAPAQDPPALTVDDLVRLELHGGDLAAALDVEVARPPLPAAAWFALRKVVSAAHPLLLALAALGVAAAWRAGAGRALAPTLGALGAWLAAHALLKANVGYTSDVHTSAAGVLVAAPAALGLLALAARLAAPHGRSARVAGRALLALTLAALLPKALAPQRAAYAPERELGRWLRAQAGPGPLALSGHDGRVVAHHAGAAWVDLPPAPPREALAALRARGVRFLVVLLRRRGADGPRAPAIDAALRDAGAEVVDHAFAVTRGPLRYDWRVYRTSPTSERRP